jgi:hypothetical protein
MGPAVVFAILILVATHFIAKLVQWGVREADRRGPGFETASGCGRRIGRGRARAALLLAGVAGRLSPRCSRSAVGRADPGHQPDQRSLRFPTALLGAGLFFFAGLILARIVRHVIEAGTRAPQHRALLGRAGIRSASRRWRWTRAE